MVRAGTEATRFLRPAAVRNEVSCFRLDRKGGTSVAVKIEAWARDHARSDSEKATEGVFTGAALDQGGKPRDLGSGDEPKAC